MNALTTLVRHRSVRTLLVAGAILLTGASATAEPLGQQPTAELAAVEDAQLAGLEVAKVQPVVLADAAEAELVRGTVQRASHVAEDAEAAERLGSVEIDMAGVQTEDGLDFAGSSTQLDVLSLKYGYILGTLPVIKALSPAKFSKTVGQLEQMAKMNNAFSAGTRAQIERFVASARRGEIDHAAYLGMMREAARGIASSNDPSAERRHGYLLSGLWGGLAMLSAQSGNVPANVADTGDMLVQLLEKDAAFGGSDRAIASKVRVVAAELKKDRPDTKVVLGALQGMMSVKQDA